MVGLSLPDREGEPENSLDELALLLGSLGIEVLGSVVQRRECPDPACLIGRGKQFR